MAVYLWDPLVRRVSKRVGAVAFAVLVLGSCAPAAAPPPDLAATERDWVDGLETLQADFGGGSKEDILSVDPCAVIEPLFQDGQDLTHVGFAAGVQGQGVLGTTAGFGGYDLVWDLYHQQMMVSSYLGHGLASIAIGGSVTAYAEVGLGFDQSVMEWNGYFVNGSVNVGLPFLKDYLSLQPSFFVGAVDANGDGSIAVDEALVPPAGVYGFGIGVTLGFNLLPNILPVAGSLGEGYWSVYPSATRYFYDLFRSTRIARIGSALAVRLVEPSTGFACPDGWPDDSPDLACVIEFGYEGESYTRKSVSLAYSICTALGGCDIPLSWPMAGAAIGVGAFRDAGSTLFRDRCPQLFIGSGPTIDNNQPIAGCYPKSLACESGWADGCRAECQDYNSAYFDQCLCLNANQGKCDTALMARAVESASARLDACRIRVRDSRY